MIAREKIEELVGLTSPKWAWKSNVFKPGESTVYYSGPFYDENEIVSAIDAFLNGKWLVSGEHVHKFEIAFSKKFNVSFSVMVNSGSSANLVMLAALKKYFKWTDDAEIIVSPVGFPTTIAPIVQNRMKPVFVDIEWETLNFDLEEVKRKITSRTRAIFVSPVLGNPPNMDALRQLCEGKNILLVGDNCDSLGSRWNGKLLGDYYFAWSSSFYPAHHITTGEGGMVSANDESFIALCRSLAWWGRDCHCVGAANLLPCGTCGTRFSKWLDNYDGMVDHRYLFTSMGYNLKPLDLQGALGLEQLKKIDHIKLLRNEHKHAIGDFVEKHINICRVVRNLPAADPAWFGVPIVVEPLHKNRVQQHFESNKIQTRNYFAGNILLHPGYSDLGDYREYPNANRVLDEVFFLGCSPHYNEQILNYIHGVCLQWTL
jgi:CDP-6-deoxy-D-xylo-4-hexulose-3-dehydrase